MKIPFSLHFYRLPRWAQAAIGATIFLALLLAMRSLGETQALVYLGVGVVFSLGFVVRFGLRVSGQIDATFESASQEAVTKTRVLRSDNSLARYAALTVDPADTAMTRLLLLGPRSGAIALLLPSGLGWWWIAPLLVMTLVAFGRLQRHLAQQEFAGAQFRRDVDAARTLEELRAGAAPSLRYFLYLRPFSATNRLHFAPPDLMRAAQADRLPVEHFSEEGAHTGVDIPLARIHLPLAPEPLEAQVNPELERTLERGLQSLGRLVALGQPGEAQGAGRIATEEATWQADLRRLAARASGFVILPSAQPGTRWEIDWLRRERAYRDCYFLAVGAGDGFDLDSWQRLGEALAPILRLPRHPGAPAMFCIDAQGRPHIAALGDTAFASTAQRARVLVRPAAVAAAVDQLIPVAAHDDGTSAPFDLAASVLAALSAGLETLAAHPQLDPAFRESIAGPAAQQVAAAAGLVPTDGTEEVVYTQRRGMRVCAVTQSATRNGSDQVAYLWMTAEAAPHRVLSVDIVPLAQDIAQRRHVAAMFNGAPRATASYPRGAAGR